MKVRSHANIPVFIPHLGCPNQCVFCDQRAISGVCEFSEEDVTRQIEEALHTLDGSGKECEIAFFGGSFTGIDRALMIRLLDLAESYVQSGKVLGIRMSTRPDYIDDEIIDIIGGYTLTEVELGVQSMTDRVLASSKRGHTVSDTVLACKKLKTAGIPFVGQMMIGLPASAAEDEIYCAERICELGAVGSRIYPTVVFRRTELKNMSECGNYTPLSTEEAVCRSANALEVFVSHGVKCLRIGLCESEALHSEEKYYAGPSHPAIGELVRGELYFRRIKNALENSEVTAKTITVEVPSGDISAAVGIKKKNRLKLEELTGGKIKFTENNLLEPYSVRITL